MAEYTPEDLPKKDRKSGVKYLTAITLGLDEFERLNTLWDDFARMIHYTVPADKLHIQKYAQALGKKVVQLQTNIMFWQECAKKLGMPARILKLKEYNFKSGRR